MAALDELITPALTFEEILSDGSTLTNPAADGRRLFLGEDGLLHLKDSAGVVTNPASSTPFIGCMAYYSTTQSFAASTSTYMLLDSEEYDYSGQPMHFASAANLTGTVTKTATSATLAGSSTLFSSELAVGQIISVPGTATEYRVVTAIASNTSLTVSGVFANTAAGQTATRVNSGIIAPVAGYYRINGCIWYATTSGTNYLMLDKNRGGVSAGALRGSRTAQNGGGSGMFFASPPLLLAQWDIIEMVGHHTEAGTLATGNTGASPSQQNFLSMQYVGA